MRISIPNRFLVGFVLAALGSGISAATRAEPQTSQEDLASIAATLRRIEELVRAESEAQRIELLLRRAELAQQELAPLQNELRYLRSNIEMQEENFRLSEDRLETLTNQAENPDGSFSADEVRNAKNQLEPLETQVKLWKARLQDQRARRDELDAQVTKLAAESEATKSTIDRALARLAPTAGP